MGFSFRPAGCGNRVEERRHEIHNIKTNGSPRCEAKTEEKPTEVKQAASMIGTGPDIEPVASSIAPGTTYQRQRTDGGR